MGYKIIFLIVIILGLVIYVTGSIFFSKNNNELPSLTKDNAVSLIKQALINGECKSEGEEDQYQSCSVVISKFGNDWRIEIFYDGFYDDSVRGSRIHGTAVYEDESWKLNGDIKEDFRCHRDRGHQDYSTELCI